MGYFGFICVGYFLVNVNILEDLDLDYYVVEKIVESCLEGCLEGGMKSRFE